MKAFVLFQVMDSTSSFYSPFAVCMQCLVAKARAALSDSKFSSKTKGKESQPRSKNTTKRGLLQLQLFGIKQHTHKKKV